MAEGPEFRRVAHKLAAVLVGKDIESVTFGLLQLRRFENALAGQVVTTVDTCGKPRKPKKNRETNTDP